MLYYVIGPDGSRFGPADVTMLSQWASEGRVHPGTTLQEDGTGRNIPASAIPGLCPAPSFAATSGAGQPDLTSATLIAGARAAALPGTTTAWAVTAIVFSVFSIFGGLFTLGLVAAGLSGNVPHSPPAVGGIEILVAVYFIVGCCGVLTRNPAAPKHVIAAGIAAIVLNFIDIVPDPGGSNLVFQIGCSIYCLFLIVHMRSVLAGYRR